MGLIKAFMRTSRALWRPLKSRAPSHNGLDGNRIGKRPLFLELKRELRVVKRLFRTARRLTVGLAAPMLVSDHQPTSSTLFDTACATEQVLVREPNSPRCA